MLGIEAVKLQCSSRCLCSAVPHDDIMIDDDLTEWTICVLLVGG